VGERRLVRILLDIPIEHQEMKMAMATDPVCGMRVDTEDAPATAEYDGKTYYFCSQACHDRFVADPASFADEQSPG
jgi:P-type Cu+ transporter